MGQQHQCAGVLLSERLGHVGVGNVLAPAEGGDIQHRASAGFARFPQLGIVLQNVLAPSRHPLLIEQVINARHAQGPDLVSGDAESGGVDGGRHVPGGAHERVVLVHLHRCRHLRMRALMRARGQMPELFDRSQRMPDLADAQVPTMVEDAHRNDVAVHQAPRAGRQVIHLPQRFGDIGRGELLVFDRHDLVIRMLVPDGVLQQGEVHGDLARFAGDQHYFSLSRQQLHDRVERSRSTDQNVECTWEDKSVQLPQILPPSGAGITATRAGVLLFRVTLTHTEAYCR